MDERERLHRLAVGLAEISSRLIVAQGRMVDHTWSDAELDEPIPYTLVNPDQGRVWNTR